MNKNFYKEFFLERKKLYEGATQGFYKQIDNAASAIANTFKKGNKLLIFGNGGSAAEAQHFSAELISQFEKKRRALPAIALTTDTSVITARANDFGFEEIFSRQIEALGGKGDIAFGITTSDALEGDSHSRDILNGFKTAKELGLITIGLFSEKTKNLLSYTDYPVIVPHKNTAIIQEVHLSVIHLICRLVEDGID